MLAGQVGALSLKPSLQFEPCIFFFYSSLIRLDSTVVLRVGTAVTNLKMW
jgi:hypothetical protein